MNLAGMNREQIAHALRHKSAEEIIELFYQHVTLEPHYTDKEIAARRRISPRKVKDHMRTGVIAPAHQDGETNSWTAPLSAVRRYDEHTAIDLEAVARSKAGKRRGCVTVGR